MHPIQLITSPIFNIFALTLIATDVYFIREWYNHKDIMGDERYANWCIAIAIFCFLIISLGKFIIKMFLGKQGKDEPNMERSDETEILEMQEGHQIFVEFYGPEDAQPIIFIHGWSSNSTQWYYLKKYLTQYRLILMDLPGCGNSSKKINHEYSPERFAIDLEHVIKLTGNKKPILLGHSIGGMTILNYCKLFQSHLTTKIAGIVLVQTTYTNPVKTSIMSGLLTAIEKPILTPMCHIMIGLAPILQVMNWIKYLNGSLHVSNHFTGFAGTETKGQLELTAFLSAASPVGVMARGMLGMFRYDATATLKQISVPALILAGNKDILCKPEASMLMVNTIPDAELVMLEPSGHMGPLERNDDMILAVVGFVKNIEKRKAASLI